MLLELGRRLRDRPPSGLRVLLLSTGAEESFCEGMRGWLARHADELDPERTSFLCLDCVGSEELVLFEGEGMLRMRDYHRDFKELVAGCAAREGVGLRRGMRLRNATDGLLPLAAGYRAVCISSMDRATNAPRNYHWPTDTLDNVELQTVAGATQLTAAVVDALARPPER